MRTTTAMVVLGVVAGAASVAARAEETVLTLRPDRTRVAFLLDATTHEVKGTFALESGQIRFDPAGGAASGEVRIDLRAAATGNQRRDRTMHRDVLETGRFPFAVFRPTRVRGALAPSGSSQLTLDGTLDFHGGSHPIELPVSVVAQGGRVTADAKLAVPYVAWGLHDPSVLFLRVGKTVSVTVHAEGKLGS